VNATLKIQIKQCFFWLGINYGKSALRKPYETGNKAIKTLSPIRRVFAAFAQSSPKPGRNDTYKTGADGD
jgi:hypothetical protein